MKDMHVSKISVSIVLILLAFSWKQSAGFADNQASVSISSPSNQDSVKSDFDIRAHVTSGQSVKKIAVVLYDSKDQVIASESTRLSVQQTPTIEIDSPQEGKTVSGTVTVTTKGVLPPGHHLRLFAEGSHQPVKEFNPGQEPFEFDWDTTKEKDGPMTLRADVTGPNSGAIILVSEHKVTVKN